jgi:hypothetical protein
LLFVFGSMDLQSALTVEPTGEKLHGPCECCGNVTRTVWGYLHRESGATLASYFVTWTVNSPRHDAYIDLIIGRWGEGASAEDRNAVSLAYRASEGSCMVIDAAKRPVASSSLIGAALPPTQVVDRPISLLAYAAVDAIWLREARIAEILSWPRSSAP